jgi:hypothetical protein
MDNDYIEANNQQHAKNQFSFFEEK